MGKGGPSLRSSYTTALMCCAGEWYWNNGDGAVQLRLAKRHTLQATCSCLDSQAPAPSAIRANVAPVELGAGCSVELGGAADH